MEVDRDRPHFRTGSNTAATSELFICFSSRLSSSSSSMKLSKSILSPGRAARDGPVALSSSLSRRLRTNGSLKGGASPFFTASGKKKGCAYENPEPSSPKVTCIGQVRVKTKKKVKQSRSLSNRRSGEASFRKIDHSCGEGGQLIEDKWLQRCSNASGRYQQECLPHRNQRWVHLPVSICEALRAEFSCLFPCKSSCFSNSERDQKCVKQNGNENGCGAVFARWMVSVNDGEGGNRREIELVVGGGDGEEEAERMSIRSSRRHVFEDIEVKDDRIELKGQRLEGEEEEARVSICIPPKNALLLMRCRSDPMKMAALVNRFSWDGDAALEEEKEEEKVMVEEDIVVCEERVEDVCQVDKEVFEAVSGEPIEEMGNPDEVVSILEVEQGGELRTGEEVLEQEINSGSEEMVGAKAEISEEMVREKAEILEVEEEEEEMVGEKTEILEVEEEEEVESNMSSFEALLVQENSDNYEDCPVEDKEAEEDEECLICHLPPSDSDEENVESETEQSENDSILSTDDRDNQLKSDSETTTGDDGDEPKYERAIPKEETGNEEAMKTEEVLPECLLLMMREPKLSMEVSKETWVCTTDFIRWLLEKPPKPAKADKDHAPPSELHQPPRSSCSLPAVSMATMLEQRLVNAVDYEPFVLTRCKSEPMRTAAVKLMPESCVFGRMP